MVRTNNEDSLIVCPEDGLFGVCDGLGGHAGGEVASGLASRVFVEMVRDSVDNNDPLSSLQGAVTAVNRTILEEQRTNAALRGMATTLSVVWISPEEGSEAWLAHVGDTRIYRLRGEKFEQLTEDDSPVFKLFQRGLINKEQMQRHPQKSLIDRCLGIFPRVEAHIAPVALEIGDLFLISSDGLTDNLSDEEIEEIVAAQPLEAAAQELVERACQAGGSDNITLVLIYITAT